MQFRTMIYLVLLVLVLMRLSVSPVSAQGPGPTDDEVNRIAKQLYCPVCESTPLDVCPTEACRQWRDLIRLQDVGWTMTDASLCGLGQTAASAVLSAIKLWPELFNVETFER